jgi:hypothetical protein
MPISRTVLFTFFRQDPRASVHDTGHLSDHGVPDVCVWLSVCLVRRRHHHRELHPYYTPTSCAKVRLPII